MKRIRWAVLALCLALLAGCAAGTADPESATTLNLEQCEAPVWVTCRIVDGAEEGTLLLAELDQPLADGPAESLHDGKSVYRLTVGESVAVYLDGEPAAAADLRDGMPVEISFNGAVAETFPAQLGEVYELHAYSIGTPQSPGGSLYDLCGLYLKVLDDLWERDKGLNEDISVAGLDLSQVPGELLESEKAALAWRFGEMHGVEVVSATFDELKEQGYLTEVELPSDTPSDRPALYEWQDGCLFSITPNTGHEGEVYSLPVLFFNAEKWRTPLGAYMFLDCSAGWAELGAWSTYSIGSEAIS